MMENLESGAQLRRPRGTRERQDYKMMLSHGGRQCSVNEGERCACRLAGRKGHFHGVKGKSYPSSLSAGGL